MFIVRHSEGFSVIEPCGETVELGDVISGNLDWEGPEPLKNVTQGVQMPYAIVQACFPTFEPANQMLIRIGGL